MTVTMPVTADMATDVNVDCPVDDDDDDGGDDGLDLDLGPIDMDCEVHVDAQQPERRVLRDRIQTRKPPPQPVNPFI